MQSVALLLKVHFNLSFNYFNSFEWYSQSSCIKLTLQGGWIAKILGLESSQLIFLNMIGPISIFWADRGKVTVCRVTKRRKWSIHSKTSERPTLDATQRKFGASPGQMLPRGCSPDGHVSIYPVDMWNFPSDVSLAHRNKVLPDISVWSHPQGTHSVTSHGVSPWHSLTQCTPLYTNTGCSFESKVSTEMGSGVVIMYLWGTEFASYTMYM